MHDSMAARAGWLFADLLLVLALVAFGTGIAELRPDDAEGSTAVPETPTTTAPPTATTTTTTTTAAPTGMQSTPVTIDLLAEPGGLLSSGDRQQEETQRLADALLAAMAAEGIDERDVGMVLTFGHAPERSRARNLAESFNSSVLTLLPQFDGAALRNFWWEESRYGPITLELYLLE